jgi:hypothetical protein
MDRKPATSNGAKFTSESEYEQWVTEDLVRVTGEDGIYRFKAFCTNRKGDTWIDVFGPVKEKKLSDGRRVMAADPAGAQMRSFQVDRIVDVQTRTSSRTESGLISKGEKKVATPQKCLCKCGGETKGGKFIPGHDARLKGQFITAFREAKTADAKAKVTAQVKAINPMWTKYLTEAKPAPVKKAPATKKASTKGLSDLLPKTGNGRAPAKKTSARKTTARKATAKA